MRSFHSHSDEETIQLGRSFAASLKNGDVVALSGDLGSGKTHFIAGACAGLGVQSHVSSPTFTIINEYQGRGTTVVHVDLYRITSSRELFELGVIEYFNESCVCLIEWAERMVEYLPPEHIEIKLAYGEEQNDRLIMIDEKRGNARSAEKVAL